MLRVNCRLSVKLEHFRWRAEPRVGPLAPHVMLNAGRTRRAAATMLPAPDTPIAWIRGSNHLSENHLLELAGDVVKRALAAGATDAECTIAEGEEFTANVRMRELESLKEAGSRGAGLRILVGRRTGASYTSDLSPEGIEKLVHSAVELADITLSLIHI